MMKIIKAFSALLIIVHFVFAQCPEYDLQPPQLKDVAIRSRIVQNKEPDYLIFRYTITNGARSTGCINGFKMDITCPSNGAVLPKNGLIDYPEYIDRVRNDGIIPVGIPRLPRRGKYSNVWSAGFGVDGTVDWFRRFEKFKLEPGATLDSLILTTYGLPGLRRFVVLPSYHPKPPVEVTPENEDSVRAHVPWTYEDEMEFQRLLDSINWKGITVGPTTPPFPFIPAGFIDTIASYKHQSLALGWIKDQHIDQRLDRKLERAKRLLQMAETWPPGSSPLLDETEKALKEDDDECSREYGHEAVHEMPHPPLDEEKLNELGRFRGGQRWDKTERPDDNQRKEQYRDVLYWAAREVLESFVREVEILNRLTEKGLPAVAGKRQYLTSEAYALLKYNAEYLIDQMPEKKKK